MQPHDPVLRQGMQPQGVRPQGGRGTTSGPQALAPGRRAWPQWGTASGPPPRCHIASGPCCDGGMMTLGILAFYYDDAILQSLPIAWSVDTISLTYSFISHNGETHFALSGAFFWCPKSKLILILWKERETQRVYLKGSLKCPFEPKYPPASNSTTREPFGWVFKNFLFVFTKIT